MFIKDKKILRLVASGCSFTYGYGLGDTGLSWPNQLAQNFDIGCVNLAQKAAGNDHIISSLITYFTMNRSHQQDSFVAIGLTSHQRIEFLQRQSDQPFYTIMTHRLKSEADFIEQFYTERYNDKFYYKKYLRNILLLQSLLKNWNIPYIMIESLQNPHFDYAKDIEVQQLKLEIDLDSGLGLFEKPFKKLTDYREALPDGHPNAVAHKQMADLLYKHLINNYGVENGK